MRAFRPLPAILLALFVFALGGCADGNFMEVMTGGPGLFGLIILIADIWAFLQISGSKESTGSKLLWGLLVFFFPVGGFLIWYFAGPKSQ